VVPEATYEDWELELQEGDIVIAYTDGIIEAENSEEEMYGTERLEQVVKNMDSTTDAEGVIEIVLQDVAHFVRNVEQYDDMTIVVVKKLWA
jgi:sigma-B regulation protein RsbU (phosphoserine phosphatase)